MSRWFQRWRDPIIHAMIGASFVWFLSPAWLAAAVNAAFWPQREWDQRRIAGKEPGLFSAQNHREAWTPALVGVIIAAIRTLTGG